MPLPDATAKALADLAKQMVASGYGTTTFSFPSLPSPPRVPLLLGRVRCFYPWRTRRFCLGAVSANRLAELARLSFLSTAQEYTEHFNALLYYTSNLAPAQKAELFMLALDLPAQVSSKLTYTHTNSHSCRMKKG